MSILDAKDLADRYRQAYEDKVDEETRTSRQLITELGGEEPYNILKAYAGAGLDPEEGHTVGSPSMLVGWYIQAQNANRKVYYDKAPDEGAYTYLIHDKALMPERFNPGSCIIDPYRELKHSDQTKHCAIRYYGNSRVVIDGIKSRFPIPMPE